MNTDTGLHNVNCLLWIFRGKDNMNGFKIGYSGNYNYFPEAVQNTEIDLHIRTFLATNIKSRCSLSTHFICHWVNRKFSIQLSIMFLQSFVMLHQLISDHFVFTRYIPTSTVCFFPLIQSSPWESNWPAQLWAQSNSPVGGLKEKGSQEICFLRGSYLSPSQPSHSMGGKAIRNTSFK